MPKIERGIKIIVFRIMSYKIPLPRRERLEPVLSSSKDEGEFPPLSNSLPPRGGRIIRNFAIDYKQPLVSEGGDEIPACEFWCPKCEKEFEVKRSMADSDRLAFCPSAAPKGREISVYLGFENRLHLAGAGKTTFQEEGR